jgi:hypothetical protein
MLAAACALAAPAAAQAATVPVQQLNGKFAASNSTVTKTPDGVHFGTYADSGCPNPAENCAGHGGTLEYFGASGLTLSQITSLGYTFNYRSANEPGLLTAAPYMRVFFTDGNNVEFDPSRCAQNDVAQATDVAIDVVADTVRFSDDGCTSLANQQPWADVVAAHPDEVVSEIDITQGFTTGVDTSAMVRNLTVNGTTFAFDAPAPAPAPAVVTQTTTVVQQVPGPAAPAPAAGVAGVQVSRTCRGATLRRLHAPTRKGERFLRVNAALQTATGLRSLRAQGRTVSVDLRNRPEANYNVRLISRYRTKSGKVRRVVTRRNLSVACS